jgi:hypothetical protein
MMSSTFLVFDSQWEIQTRASKYPFLFYLCVDENLSLSSVDESYQWEIQTNEG